MLSRVILKNFQSHKELDLELSSFTTLTGGSNGGKSAVLRAILALVRNDSAGDYLRHGQKTLSVKLVFDSGDSVEWIKGSGENKYVLSRPGEKDQEFDKVGAGVPDEVAEVLKLGPIVIGKNDKQYVNFHQQLEPPFLISSTPGDVAKLFGELTSASQLYTAVNEGNRVVRSVNSSKTTRMGDLRQAKIELEDFQDLEVQRDGLRTVKTLLEDGEKVSTSIGDLASALKSISDLDARITEAEAGTRSLSGAEGASLDALVDAGSRAGSLEQLIKDYETCTGRITKGENGLVYLDVASGADLEALHASERALDGLTALSSQILRNRSSERELTANVASVEKDIAETFENIRALVQELDNCLECNQYLDDGAREFLLTNGNEYVTH